MREGFELIFVAVFANVAADVVFRLVCRNFGLVSLRDLRRTAGAEPDSRAEKQHTD
jgi:hypothetical protein